MKYKSYRGSYSIEAALVIPIVLIVIITVIYYSFYLHDSLVMKSLGYSFALDNYNYQDFSEDELSSIAIGLMDSKTIIVEHISVKVKLNNDGMDISYQGEFSFPFLGLKKILKESVSEINRETQVGSVLKSDFLRKCKVAKDAINIE